MTCETASCSSNCSTNAGLPGFAADLAQRQYAAAAARLPAASILQWWPRKLDWSRLEDQPPQRELLRQPTVQAVSIGEFKRAVVARLRAADAVPVTSPGDACVRISLEEVDRPLANEIQRVLDEHQVAYDATNDEDFMARLDFFHGVIVVYGQAQSAIAWNACSSATTTGSATARNCC